ncbi:MAG: hypothetical protein K0S55_277 [Clostridia bacterium]|jgi:hypothetical protein|nr:hypothetical protein [Clostridia bacterium]
MPINSEVKNNNFTPEAINFFLNLLKTFINNGKFTIPRDDKKAENILNAKFISDYKISSKRLKEIILSIDRKDFRYVNKIYNNTGEYIEKTSYVFLKKRMLCYSREPEEIRFLVKIHIEKIQNISDYFAVIYFEPEYKNPNSDINPKPP